MRCSGGQLTDCSLSFAVGSGAAAAVADVHGPLVQPLARVLVVEDGHALGAVLPAALAVKSNLIERNTSLYHFHFVTGKLFLAVTYHSG